ncbi:unnamed protein product [Cyclocybe aegerita]|uniref:BTB domain-containing protein n=1 Tax=Cyclocybe aegerita TaxID=1973307 RepID=A0A8S0WUD6_CYCAE|nr:unnamed protein product [Cyclocybe aegerita]
MSQLPSKRPRVDGSDDATEHDGDAAVRIPPVQRSEKFWIEDGNVILHVEDTQFRVHRSMLTRHSTIFKDVFSVPPPSSEQARDPVLEGCPVVKLSDRAGDMEQILSIFYDNASFLDLREDIPIGRLAAMLRLGKKYDIAYLRDEALKRFRSEFPTTLEAFDASYGDTRGPSIDYDSPSDLDDISTIICLSQEHGLPSIMPAACFNLVYYIPPEKILDEAVLPQELRNRCIMGQDHLIRTVHNILFDWTESESFMSPDHCTGDHLDGYDRKKVLRELNDGLWLADDGSVWCFSPTLPGNVQETLSNLCASCSESVISYYHAARKEVWQELPIFFGFRGWEDPDLKDFDS